MCLSMQRHHRDLFGKIPSKPIAWGLRVLGYALLISSLWLCVNAFGASVGVVVWMGMLSAAGLLLVGLLAWKPKSVPWIGLVGLPLALTVYFMLSGITE